MKTYKETALRLHSRGLQTMPAKGKACYIKGWPRIGKGPVDRTEFEIYAAKYPRHNTALIMGDQCPLIAIDIDCDDYAEAGNIGAQAMALFGDTPLVRLGKAGGRAMLFYRKGTGAFPDVRGQSVEIFSNVGLVILYGRHPSGIAYRWSRGNPIDTPLDTVPEITAEQMRQFVEGLPRRAPIAKARGKRGAAQSTNIAGCDEEIAAFVFDVLMKKELARTMEGESV